MRSGYFLADRPAASALAVRLLPRGEHALHPLLVAVILLILVVRPLVELHLLPVSAMAIGLQVVILAGLFSLNEASNRTRHLALVAVLTSSK